MSPLPSNPRVVVISGLSGSGKTIALRALEDIGFFCIDNLPAELLPSLAEHIDKYPKIAIGLDSRTGGAALDAFGQWLAQIRQRLCQVQVLFLTATSDRLVRRFSETRRRHPLVQGKSLIQAIAEEERLLEPVRQVADWIIDTSDSNLHDLRQRLWALMEQDTAGPLVLKSFAYRHGLPADLDLLFDARCLPNPHWQEALRPLTGRDQAIQDFLDHQDKAQAMLRDLSQFLHCWLPEYQAQQRGQVTVGIGCTGGRHRSVYLVEQLARILRLKHDPVIVHHRELL